MRDELGQVALAWLFGSALDGDAGLEYRQSATSLDRDV